MPSGWLSSRATRRCTSVGCSSSRCPRTHPDYLKLEFERMREARAIPSPWNLKRVEPPLLGGRAPLMRETRDVDLDYHVRHSALPHPGGQRELGILVSRLHSH